MDAPLPTRHPASAEPQGLGRRGVYAKGTARRQEILDRAIEVVSERGSAGASLRKIAEAIGVSHAALLHYFDTREQLLVAVYEHHEKRRQESEPPNIALLNGLLDAPERNLQVPGLVELYTTLVASALSAENSTSHAFFTTRFANLRERLSADLAEQQHQGTVRSDISPDALAALVIAMSDGLQVQWLLDDSVELHTILRTVSTLLAP